MSRILGNAARLLGLLALVFACSSRADAASGLSWERTTIEAAAKAGQRVVTFEFRFENKGKGPVTLVSTEASCRCVSVDGSMRTYRPGEKGVLRAAFSVGNGRGLRQQSITVTTDDVDAKPVELILRMTLAGVGD